MGSKSRSRRQLSSPNGNGRLAAPHIPTFSALPAVLPPSAPIKLDIGCGPNCRADGFEGVDILSFGGKVKHILDVRSGKWPWADGSVAEVHASHFLEHLTNLNDKWERIHFFNEVYRILTPPQYDHAGKPVSGFATIIIPHWCSQRYYGDPTHKEPFSEMALWYLDKNWRLASAPHTDSEHNPHGYSCDFIFNMWYNVHPQVALKNQEGQQFAMTFYKEACQDQVFQLWRKT